MKIIVGKAILILIILLGFYLRFINIDWDKGYIFHPDERAIIMNTTSLSYPRDLAEFFTPESNLNTNFFAYGNLPIYLLKISGDTVSNLDPIYSQYSGIYLVGRLINVLFSTLTIILVFIYARSLFNKKIALVSSFFFAIAVFPIQNAHFFTVDTMLTFLTTLSLITLHWYYIKPTFLKATLIGIVLGMCLATKISSIPIILTIFSFLIICELFRREKTRNIILNTSAKSLMIIISALVVFIITQPYAIIDYNNFITQIHYQSQMGTDPFVFPYTLQYVGKINFLYEIKNMTFWGLGIPLGFFSIIGYLLLLKKISSEVRKEIRLLPILLFTTSFFVINALYAVGWMRYLLPIYPLLTIFAGYFVVSIYDYLTTLKILKNIWISYSFLFLLLFFSYIWTLSFLNVYLSPHPKISATEWITDNIPGSSTIATEHWDDILPIYGGERYNFISLPLYEADTPEKWIRINNDLATADYIILASNRLYTPLSKLTECENLPEGKCYLQTAQYYEELFAGNRGFKKVAEFHSYPKIPFLNIEINDQSADESFTVYDHPKILIYKKNEKY